MKKLVWKYLWLTVASIIYSCGVSSFIDANNFAPGGVSVIVAVTDGDRILLTKYAGRTYRNYALIAGFTEIGETVEETVMREVYEEVGVHVKNLRYYKSQPWALSGSLLYGYFCELDGDDSIHLQEDELSVGKWFHADELDIEEDDVSLTREMICKFVNEHKTK